MRLYTPKRDCDWLDSQRRWSNVFLQLVSNIVPQTLPMAAFRDPGGPRAGDPAARAPVEAERIEIDTPYRWYLASDGRSGSTLENSQNTSICHPYRCYTDG